MAAQTVIMASSSAVLSGRSANKPFTGTPIKQTRAVAVPRCRQHVVSAAAKEEQTGPNKAALGLFGAFAAAQLALLPAGPAEAFSLFPKTAISQEARDKLNRKTSNLPSLKETGKELTGGSDPIGNSNPGSPKEVGKAIDRNTPDAPNLTKNPQSLGKDAVKGIKNALPDVSYVPTKEDIIKKFRSNKGATKSVAKGKAGNPLKSNPLKSNPLSGGGNPLSGGGNPLSGGGNPLSGGAGNKAASKAKATVNKAASKVPSADEIKNKLKGSPVGALPDPKELVNKAKANAPNPDTLASKAKAQTPDVPKPLADAKSKIKNSPAATIGLPTFEVADLPNPKELVNKAKANAPNPDTLASKAKAQTPDVPKPLADAKSKIKNTPAATIGLPAFELADLQGQNNQSDNYPSPGKGSFPLAGPLAGKGDKITSPTDDAMDPPKYAGGQAPGADAGVSSIKEVGQAAKDALPDVPDVPTPKGNPIDSIKGLFGQ